MLHIIKQYFRGMRGVAHTYFQRPSLPKIAGETIGFSVSNKPIQCYQMGNGPIKIILVGGLHGNEIGTSKLSTYLFQLFTEEQYRFQNISLYCIPTLNPDGKSKALTNPNFFGGGNIGRMNANNVDLNRNFPSTSFQNNAKWNHGHNYKNTREVFAGKSPGSEPETKAIMKYILEKKPNLVIAYHNCGNDIMPSNDALSKQLAKVYATTIHATLLPYHQWSDLDQTGTFAEWCTENTISFLEIETPYRWGTDCKRQKKGFLETLRVLTEENM